MPLGERTKTRTVRLRWSNQVIVLAGTVGGLPTLIGSIRANAPYDPDTAAGGATVYDWARYQALYNHYVVVGAKCTCMVVPYSASNISLVLMSKLDDDNTAFVSTQSYYKWMGDPNYRQKIKQSGPTVNNMIKLTRYFSAKKFFGRDPMTDENQSSLTSSTPVEQAFFNFAIQAADLVTVTPAVTVITTIDYIVKFREPKDQYNIL